MGRVIQMGQVPRMKLPPMQIPELFPFGLPPSTLPPPAPGSFGEWLNQEAIGGVKMRLAMAVVFLIVGFDAFIFLFSPKFRKHVGTFASDAFDKGRR